ncbi:MAG: heavy metal translocating P-type ATPase [Armatimonadetes bacterium]|nr:heavy metal translocating P-type ATPase [Armatimonadota bacterium]
MPGVRSVSDRHAAHDIELLRRKFWIALILTIPVLVYSKEVQELLGFRPPASHWSEYISFSFGTVIFFYGGIFFLNGAVGELKTRQPGMMTLVSIAITVAFVYSALTTFRLVPGKALYWELSTLVTVMLLGHWMEMQAVGKAKGALQELARLMPDEAERIKDDTIERISVGDIQKGDLLLVRPGAKVPADGEVVSGESSVNEAMITGESMPVRKSPGSKVIAGTVNGNGSLRVRVTKVGEETMLAGIMRLVAEAQSSRSMAQNLADRAAYWLTIIAITAGVLTLLFWTLLSPPQPFANEPRGTFAIVRAVTVLVIACPHALGLAIPLVIAISTSLAARNGLLIRDRLALEQARNLDVVVFDKTGTLTKGEYGVVAIYHVAGLDENEVLAIAAAVEKDSEHILAQAVVRSAQARNLSIPDAVDFKALPGLGVEAKIGGRTIRVGGPRLLESLGLNIPEELKHSLDQSRRAGQTLVFVLNEDEIQAAIALADVIRSESKEAVMGLKRMGLQVAMMTGDSWDVARWVAEELGIDEYYANLLPEDKAKRIQQIRQEERRVAMVGDGINDAPALVLANIGIAIGAGTDITIESGGIILVRNDPRDIFKIIRLSQASYRKMVENLFWATGYNVVAMPLAAGVFANKGIIFSPALGALFMSISTIIVAVNAHLLRRLKLGSLR